ncbi:MAG: tRNA-dihydrouridine synthase family protein, partial [Clostridia bacterium]|nr:tRNA-dihydrouridine synthase family protein [Clostridia bacterium]
MNSMNQKIPPSVCLAPMAGFTDVSFRLLCREQGADGLFSEMVSAKGLLFESEKTKELLRIDPAEGPVTIQLFGHEPEVVLEGAKLALEIAGENCRGIDLNMGCPAPKITGNGDGSALMKDPILAGRIVEMLAKGIHLPVSVKFRAGWDAAHKNCIEFAKIMEESGAAFLTVHGRTREQQYAGKADLDCIAGVKAAVSIPVIGNGDITDGP